MSMIDPNWMSESELTSLKLKLQGLRLKRIVGLGSQEEIDRVEKRIAELEKELWDRLLHGPWY